MIWAGVDVGGRRKGFHAAIVGQDAVIELAALTTVQDLVSWLVTRKPRLVAVDCPLTPAPDGKDKRAGELALMQAGICNIRFTPDWARMAGDPYYEWIRHGLELYTALGEVGLSAIECFPTASWTRWVGHRGKTKRAVWTAEALSRLSLSPLPIRLNQDARDAIAAALTARAHDRGETEMFGDIVVPLPPDAQRADRPCLPSGVSAPFRFPQGNDSLPNDMAELVLRLAKRWATEPSRPRPAEDVMQHWDRLIDAWAADSSLPLYVRKSANNRGSVIAHRSGRHLVPTDNSPAIWAFSRAVLGERPSLAEIRHLVTGDQLPIAMVLKSTEKTTAFYRKLLGTVPNLSSSGWKIAHVDPVGLSSRGSLLEAAESTLQQHFRRLMSPRNMFAVPIRYAGLGELKEFCEAMRAAPGQDD